MHAKTTSPSTSISSPTARRLVLGATGLLAEPSGKATASTVYRLIEQLGFVQIDSINVVERAHHLILMSRLAGYRPSMLATLLEKDRLLFEHWTHDASAIPTQWFAHWRHRFSRHRTRIRANAWWQQRMGPRPARMVANVRDRIARDGPVLSRDFEDDGRPDGDADREAGWWGWKPQKAALEYLWRTGELAVARRDGFQKVYDLLERVLPEPSRLPAPPRTEHIQWACETALDRLGVATPTQIAAFWRAITPQESTRWCRQAARDGRIVGLNVESADGSPARSMVAPADWQKRVESVEESPPHRRLIRLLCPFDPVLRDRAALKRLFNFEYRFEAFVPAAKRRYGYYVMPILRGDRLVGRLDPKFHREQGVLAIRRVWWEPRVKAGTVLRRQLTDAIENLARHIGADKVQIDWSA